MKDFYDGEVYEFTTLGRTFYISGKDINNNRMFIRDASGRFASEKNVRCPKCNKRATWDRHDPCIANLPGVKNACCGHGVDEGYIQFENGVTIRGIFEVDEK